MPLPPRRIYIDHKKNT